MSDSYRYELSRVVDPFATHPRRVLWVMLNPSTADDSIDDPTIRRCIGFSRSWGFSELRVVNLFALRSTHPAGLRLSADPVGPENKEAIWRASDGVSAVVCAWGAHPFAAGRAREVTELIGRRGCWLQCLGTTKDGSPRHPLYVRADHELEMYEPRSAAHG